MGEEPIKSVTFKPKASLDAVEEAKAKKRGWVFDQLMIIGSFEAGMNHNDEQICNLYYELEGEEDEKRITELTDEIAQNREILDTDYFARVDALNDLFDAMPNSDRHYYCQVKHRATTFILAAENYHARNGDPKAENTLRSAGKSLALTCSLAFGFEPMDCLRCVADSMAKVVPQLSMVEI